SARVSNSSHPIPKPCTVRVLLPYAFVEGLFRTHSFWSSSVKSSGSNSRFNSRGPKQKQPFIVSRGQIERHARRTGPDLLLACKHSALWHEVRLLTYIRPLVAASPVRMLGHDGLFAHQFPIASSCFSHLDIRGFYRRRFDLFAIDRLAVQSWIERLLLLVQH